MQPSDYITQIASSCPKLYYLHLLKTELPLLMTADIPNLDWLKVNNFFNDNVDRHTIRRLTGQKFLPNPKNLSRPRPLV